MAGSKYAEMHRVAYYECEKQGRMSMPMLMNVAVLCSERHLIKLGLADDYVHSFGVGWVVTQYEISINRMPVVEEEIEVSTEAVSYNKFFCYRDYTIKDTDGNTLVSIHSAFVLMSFETRKMVHSIPEIIDRFQCDYITKVRRFPRITRIAETTQANQDYRVRYFDIDSNQHVNNVHYFDWMLDHLGFDFLSTHRIKTMNIKFEQEVAYGETITSHINLQRTNSEITTLHQISDGDQICAEAVATWI